ncbi:MAG TPA: hypothetical protein VKY19_11110 [Ktedonosporobacter sp.]|jgi:hypothetical protein|nr:hypothetical protein [Ktedonosporobacter sp.]
MAAQSLSNGVTLRHDEGKSYSGMLCRRYGPEVEEALVLAWNTLNRICTKRLIPFLPDLLERLEVQGYVQLSQGHGSFY